MMKRIWFLALLTALCLPLVGAALGEEAADAAMTDGAPDEAEMAEENAEEAALPAVYARMAVNGGMIEIVSTELEGERWLFLPAHADMDALTLHMEDEVFWTAPEEADEEGVFSAPVTDADGTVLFELHVMRSENLRALYLFSDDPIGHGRKWLEDCDYHENETTGSMAMVDVDGTVRHVNEITKLRGRGNSTWGLLKKPYQIKLKTKDDLLDTGVKEERSRTWVLLAENMDFSLLHNRITFDLALEIGIPEASRSEFVDLYYDGEYRGTYLLCEKVEVGEGRVDILDYDDILRALNDRAGKHDLDALEVGSAKNRFSNEFFFIQDVEAPSDPSSGGYLIELESPLTLSDRCYFTLSDGRTYAFKSPENPSEAMAAYASELLEEGRRTLLFGGTDPESGLTIADRFDIDAFARVALINELAYNVDGFSWSSSFFVLPEGETRFRPGPPWDFDLAYRYLVNGTSGQSAGLKDESGWLPLFYSCDEFRESMRNVYGETIYPVLTEILLGDGTGRYLRPLDEYAREIAASKRMNERLNTLWQEKRFQYGDTWEEDLTLLRRFLTQRGEWLYETLMGEPTQGTDDIDLYLDAIYTCVEDSQRFCAYPWSDGEIVDFSSDQVSEADEENYAIWRVEAVIGPTEGRTFGDMPMVRLNGTPLACERMEDGTLRVAFTFEDLTYRPVDFYGEDMGLVFDADEYAARHPDIAEECGGDPELLLEAFYYDGMCEGQAGNAFFNPRTMQFYMPYLSDYLYDNWEDYYLEFMNGSAQDWMETLDTRFRPPVMDALNR